MTKPRFNVTERTPGDLMTISTRCNNNSTSNLCADVPILEKNFDINDSILF